MEGTAWRQVLEHGQDDRVVITVNLTVHSESPQLAGMNPQLTPDSPILPRQGLGALEWGEFADHAAWIEACDPR